MAHQLSGSFLLRPYPDGNAFPSALRGKLGEPCFLVLVPSGGVSRYRTTGVERAITLVCACGRNGQFCVSKHAKMNEMHKTHKK